MSRTLCRPSSDARSVPPAGFRGYPLPPYYNSPSPPDGSPVTGTHLRTPAEEPHITGRGSPDPSPVLPTSCDNQP